MNHMEFAEAVISMPVEKQNEFFENLKSVLSADEWETTVKFISLYAMFKNPEKYEAMKDAVADIICEDIFGHTVERRRS